jgi:hypothetical protein
MATILENRARISQNLQKESEQGAGLKQHAPITTVKDIIRSLQKGRDPARTSRDFGVDLAVVKKLEGIYAVPVDNSDGIVCTYFGILIDWLTERVNGLLNDDRYTRPGNLIPSPTSTFRVEQTTSLHPLDALREYAFLYIPPSLFILFHRESLRFASNTTSPEAKD